MIGLEYALSRSGPLSMAPSQLGCFAYSLAATRRRPNLEYHVQPLQPGRLRPAAAPLTTPFTASSHADRCDLAQPRECSAARPQRRHSAGDPAQLSQRSGRSGGGAGGARADETHLRPPALAGYHPVEHLPGADITSPDDLLAAIGRIATTIFHPAGTCRMRRIRGTNGRSATDGARRRVLTQIADASIMPTITSGNTNAPTT